MNAKCADQTLLEYSKSGIPGCTLVVKQDHKEIYRGKAGYADVENRIPMDYETIVNIYSATKVVTCVSAMILVGQGKILIDDPLSKYIPEFKNVKVADKKENGEVVLREPVREITLRHLFTMSAGLDYNLGCEELKRFKEKVNGKCQTVETMRALAERPLSFDPGTKFQYSLCHDMLGAVIEIASGMPLYDFMKKYIFEPLEMNDTHFILPEEKLSRLAQQYQYKHEKKISVNIGQRCGYQIGSEYEGGTIYQSGGAGLRSTVLDYSKFVDALACGGVGANGNRIISEELLSLMREDQYRIIGVNAFVNENRPGYSYGLGVQTYVDRAKGLWPMPIGDFGWDGAAGVKMIIDPVNHISMAYFQHQLGNPFDTRRKLANIIYS